jgi:hypothetical protein
MPGRGHNGQFRRTPHTAEKDAKASEMFAAGAKLQTIADELGYVDRSGARKAVERAMQEVVVEAGDLARQTQLARLDRMYRIAADVVEREHVTVSQGRVVHGDGGTPVTDDAIVLQALDRMLKIEARRAQLLGLDRPTKVEVHNEIDADFDRAYAELLGAMQERGAATHVPVE